MMVTFENVTKKFSRTNGELVLSGLTFSVGSGEIIGILGSNGAGKKELLKLVLGAAEPDKGRIWVMGKYPGFVSGLPTKMSRAERGKLGFMLKRMPAEGGSVGNYLSVQTGKREAGAFIQYAYEKLQIGSLEKNDIRFLSGGERTRVDFYKAVMNIPALLLLYEPDTGLDAVMKENVYAVIKELNAVFGTTVMVASQSLGLIEKLCRRVILLDRGRAVYFGGCGELKKRFASVSKVAFTIRSGFPDLQDLPVKCIRAEDGWFEAEYDASVVGLMEIVNRVLSTCKVSQVEAAEPDADSVVRNIYLQNGEGDMGYEQCGHMVFTGAEIL